ncbi:flagellar basal-body rod protein FlgC [Paenibacillus cellulosilyticus]|uniref:Flagellar basal-body rod protein FlgC n=1 Tax=Paenibacillus cellulosilyticus TaxID=375489 RepID=A0A2V2Z6B9_9BACL|nr:flagellar basal body rod protein FlgC [Paenibacillus cellulosilyticus]PWW06390.1 flagellar basal-body rod protein FlgC [Paenibacillus cellulosilyticus]QKS46263.1 flagellar basal body rod protein FlgC [Paenibacillus cellulosilyticus]
MKLSGGFDANASALTAQRLRMDVISSNIANAETTRAKYVDGKFVPYARKMVVMEPTSPNFSDMLSNQLNGSGTSSSTGGTASPGVKITQIVEDQTPFKLVYNPSHPDADEDGYVQMPNVDIAKEMIDMISATRAYEANVTALNSNKAMFAKALEIGK